MNDNDDDMTPITGDPANAFEHALREHTREAIAMWTHHTTRHEREVYITYNTADGGKWHISSYKPDVNTRGAELLRTMDAHCVAHAIHDDLSVLRGKLTYQPREDDDA